MQEFKTTPVREIMTSPVYSLQSDASLREAARSLLEKGYSGAPVVDEQERAVGVLTLQDIARYAEWHLDVEQNAAEISAEKDMLRELDRQERGLKASMHIDRLEDATVRQVMTPKVATVSTETPIAEALTQLLGASIHRLFVTGAKGKVIGLVSTMDIVRAIHERIQKA